MIYTNGKILIDWKNNPETLLKAVRTATNYLFEDRAMDALFVLDDSVSYPCYIIPEGVSYNDLDQALRPNLQFLAINEDVITLTDQKEVTEKHYFSEDEKQDLSRVALSKRIEMNKLEIRKKNTMAEFNAQINKLDEEVLEMAMKYEAGHEERDYKCTIRLNFADGNKYYIDSKDGETIRKAEPMDKKERQMRFNLYDAPAYNPETANDTPEPGSEAFDLGDGTSQLGTRESYLGAGVEDEPEGSESLPEPGSEPAIA
jgi:hypothetical protein